ncbi:S8 family serine peptidase [Nonomuraea sp. NEAU-A123]|uniref:S8 family peptidase n=1 Tax=Nonomuraea sp. NEAU-A123 TaxID=2839649 RepID=UPI001BE4AD12|nr:S8 family serine peptidase [Nonomuraea sp. NEAU-A123]MBT2227670.1 S8 family serine peptidase [Nonomuraea sp. NEAU-A123]
MTRQRWRSPSIGLLAMGLVLSTGMAVQPSPSATPAPALSGQTAAAVESSGTPAADAAKITLITGDVVAYDTGPNGNPRHQVTPAPRPDGAPVNFISVRDRNAYYVYPSDVMGLVSSGRLDKALFDVAYLAANGYTDKESASLPLIVQYGQAKQAAKTLSQQADALPATAEPRGLPSVGGAAVRVDKKTAGQFWTAVDRPSTDKGVTASLDRGLSAIWLDRKVKAVLDKSVPQIGAPEVWAAGLKGEGVKVAVLDTGIDTTHPDVADRITATANFTEEADVQDGHGHGTHVASTIVGTGAASDGKYTGVAPKASLLVGKVLNKAGSGDSSSIIAGMEWAVAQQARVISISAGACCFAGPDPLSEAVDNLSAQSTSLFVIAAGNDYDNRMIATPGSAASALTVGAVDGEEKLAPFSSKGPVLRDYSLKPDLVAPGVDIVAARAAGTSMGSVVNDKYTGASGTSMATPHVSGAAVLLAQKHPDWTGAQLKAALVSTAHDDGFGAYEQGSGRVDVARAVRQAVSASGNLDFGALAYPHKAPVTKTITYTNDGDQPVTLTLKSGVTAHKGGDAPEHTLTLDHDTVTVPAHGTAPVAVAFDPSGPATWYEGFVHAADASGAVTLSTAVGAFVEPEKVTVRTKMVLPDGATDVQPIPWVILRTDDRDDLDFIYYPSSGTESETQVYAGTFSVSSGVSWRGTDGQWNIGLPSQPEFAATKDTTITLDMRKARQVTQNTPKPTEVYNSQYFSERQAANGIGSIGFQSSSAYGLHNYWLLPTRSVTQGTFDVAGQVLRGAPVISMKADRLTLHPRYQNLAEAVPKLNGRSTLTLVSGGRGQAADLAGAGVRGKLVLLDLSDLCPANTCTGNALDRVKAAAEAGAAGVLGYGAVNRAFLELTRGWPIYPIPTMSLPADEGRALAAQLAKRPVSIQAEGITATPYIYSLLLHERGRVPAKLDYELGKRNLYEIENRLHSDRPAVASMLWEATVVTHPGWLLGARFGYSWPAQSTVTEYVGPVSPDVSWNHETQLAYPEGGTDYNRRFGMSATSVNVYPSAGAKTEEWGAQPRVPGTPVFSDLARSTGTTTCFPCRTGDTFVTALPILGPGLNNQEPFTWNARWQETRGGKDEQHLYRDGQEIPMVESGTSGPVLIQMPRFNLPEGESRYRLTDKFHTPQPLQQYATDVATEWTFSSKRPTGGMQTLSDGLCVGWFFASTLTPCEPVRRLNLRYDLDLDLDNKTAAAKPHKITVTGYQGSYDVPDARLGSLKLSVTYDDGAHWKAVTTSKKNATSYTATIAHPALSATNGTVGIRAQGVDAEGNTIDQTITRAYGLK